MSQTTQQIFQAVLSLPRAERTKLIDAILEIDHPPTPRSEEYWREEIKRRSAEVDAGSATLLTWQEAKAIIRQEVVGHA